MDTINDAITEFLTHCRYEKNLSLKTLTAYSVDIQQLSNFLTAKKYSRELVQITKQVLREFLESISALKPKSVKRKIATVKAMFNYLEFDDKISSNPLRKMRINIKEPKTLPKVLDIIEIGDIFKVAYKRYNIIQDRNTYAYREALRNIIVVELLFSTGARVSEICDLKLENINIFSGAIVIMGKGSKERIIQVCNSETLHALVDYCRLFNEGITKAAGYFLINRFGKKLTDQSVRNIVKGLATEAKIPKHVTPHVFRHSFATLLLEQEVDIKYIQSLLGHSSIMTTQIYTHVNRAKQIQILTNKHPRKELTMMTL
jgi:integrase/recombinase XerD